ncbi:MAG: tetratricopeptide repeat protein [Bryobacterales bacterium]|nr:tetratricopeptide repeat protein [Bryobacterales bacterium]
MWAGIILFGLLQEPERCGALVDQARTNYENREYVRAALDFEAALSACPGGNRARLLLAYGQCQLMAQQLEQAAATFQQVTKLDPRNVEARKLAGDALYLLGRDSEAVASMKSALEIDPLNETVHYALGRIYYQSNQFPEAVEQFGAVLAANPKSYRAHDNLGLCYDALHEDALALKHFFAALDLVIKDHPDYDWAHANLADFFLKRNQPEKAFQLAAEAARRNPASARDCFLTGKALTMLGKDELSLRWLRRAVELDSQYATAHYLLAQTLRRLGKKEEAARELEIFQKVNPKGKALR